MASSIDRLSDGEVRTSYERRTTATSQPRVVEDSPPHSRRDCSEPDQTARHEGAAATVLVTSSRLGWPRDGDFLRMAFTEIDEKALVRAYQAGNERAFDTIVRTQYNALYAHALRRLSQR